MDSVQLAALLALAVLLASMISGEIGLSVALAGFASIVLTTSASVSGASLAIAWSSRFGGDKLSGVTTAREFVVSFLHEELERAASRDPDGIGEGLPEQEGRVAGVLGVLQAVGLLGAEEAEAWRLRLGGPGMERPQASAAARRAGDELLQDLLEAVPVDDDGRGEDLRRFWRAADALRAVGASSGGWSDRLARRMGWPTDEELAERNAGGSQRDLVAVLAGPAEAVDDVWVVCALRFDDGVSLVLWLENGADPFERGLDDFELVDDVGTTYVAAGAGGGGRAVRLTYGTTPPADATRLELLRAGSRPIRISL